MGEWLGKGLEVLIPDLADREGREWRKKESERAEAALRRVLKGNVSGEDRKWMLDLHRDYTQRFVSDNNRIWTTGSIFVGIALAGFGFVVRATPINPLVLAVVGFVSFLLLYVWNLIADRHREFQDRSFVWIQAIERMLLTPEEQPEATPQYVGEDRSYERPLNRVRTLRWLLTWIVAGGWLMLVLVQMITTVSAVPTVTDFQLRH
jgi:hypothetical protein